MKRKTSSSKLLIPLSIFILTIFILIGGKIIKIVPSVLGTTTATSVKEHFIPIGAGPTNATEWMNIGGAQVTFDTKNYGSIKKVYFEASVYCATGNQTVWVRLFNVTDGNIVWNTELSASGSGPTLLTSPALFLSSGSKTYQVQMKTQLGSLTELTFARLHITTN